MTKRSSERAYISELTWDVGEKNAWMLEAHLYRKGNCQEHIISLKKNIFGVYVIPIWHPVPQYFYT